MFNGSVGGGLRSAPDMGDNREQPARDVASTLAARGLEPLAKTALRFRTPPSASTTSAAPLAPPSTPIGQLLQPNFTPLYPAGGPFNFMSFFRNFIRQPANPLAPTLAQNISNGAANAD